MVDPHYLFDLWMVSPFGDLHWQKAMYNVPCLIHSIHLDDDDDEQNTYWILSPW
jgi:hypothetical protein